MPLFIEDQRKNKHQEHFESLVGYGPSSLDELDNDIESMLDILKDKQGATDKLNLTTKIDGSPAVFIWSKYPGLPNNSISLKSFTEKTAANNAMSSVEQIEAKYPKPLDQEGSYDEKSDGRRDFRQMLEYSLELSHYIPAGECWQGDCLFTKKSKREENINGVDYITFTPNTITYAFSEENAGYNEIKNADFGIAFHTIYRGEDKQQSFKVDASRLNVPSNFYLLSPALNYNKADFDIPSIETAIDELHQEEERLLSNNVYETLTSNEEFIKYWKMFENSQTRDRKSTTIDEDDLIDNLVDFIKGKFNAAADKLKTDSGKAKQYKAAEELSKIIRDNTEVLDQLVKTFNAAVKVKMLLWDGFKKSKQDYKAFYGDPGDYTPATMEGVAMSDQDGNIVKIVDRSEFSANNAKGPNQRNQRESLEEDLDPKSTLVFSFGKFNPPTIGHVKLAQAMADCDESSNKPVIYLSHKYGVDRKEIDKSQPLDYKEKVYWCKKAFGDLVDVIESNAQTAWEALHEINEERPEIERIVFAGGDDRADGSMFANLANSNGKQTSKPSGDFDFIGGLVPLIAGTRDERSSDLAETASSSLVRRMALENDFEKFKQLVPFDENDADELFDEIRDFYKTAGLLEESINESSAEDYVEPIIIDGTEYKCRKTSGKKYQVAMGRDHYYRSWEAKDYVDITFDNKTYKAKVDSYTVNSDPRVKFITDDFVFEATQGSGRGISAEHEIGRGEDLKNKLEALTNEKLGAPEPCGSRNSKLKFNFMLAQEAVQEQPPEDVADYKFKVENKDEYVYVSIKDGHTPSIKNFGLSGVPAKDILKGLIKDKDSKFYRVSCTVLDNQNDTQSDIQDPRILQMLNTDTRFYYTITDDNVNNIIDSTAVKNLLLSSYGKDYYMAWREGSDLKVYNINDKLKKIGDVELIDATITNSTFYIQFKSDINYSLNIRSRTGKTGHLTAEIRVNTSVKKRSGSPIDD